MLSLLPLLLSHNLPLPRVHQCVRGRLVHKGLGSSSLVAHSTKHSAVLHSALERYVHDLECTQHSANPVHSHALTECTSLATHLRCTRSSVQVRGRACTCKPRGRGGGQAAGLTLLSVQSKGERVERQSQGSSPGPC